jgi:hypothetical protein
MSGGMQADACKSSHDPKSAEGHEGSAFKKGGVFDPTYVLLITVSFEYSLKGSLKTLEALLDKSEGITLLCIFEYFK